MYLTPINTWDVVALLGLLAFLLPAWLTAILVTPLLWHIALRYASTRRSKQAAPPPPPEPA